MMGNAYAKNVYLRMCIPYVVLVNYTELISSMQR